jgi:transposase
MPKKTYNAEFKAKVALEAIKNQNGIAQICSEFKVPSTNLYDWRDKVLADLHQLFVPQTEHMKRQKLADQEIENLQRVIGEITIENSYLKKKLKV